jgi:phenolic acid decarboxylase
MLGCQSSQDVAINILGRTLEYQYGEHLYHVTFDTDSTLHWEAIQGDEIGIKAEEVYIAEWIDQDKLFITWGEENGTGVSQLLDFGKGKVHNHLLFGREVRAGLGSIRWVDSPE